MDNPFLTAPILSLMELSNLDHSQWETAITARRMYEGDHWLDGKGWIGPLPLPERSETGTKHVLDEIKRIFTPRNIVSEVVNRKSDGLLVRDPSMDYLGDSVDLRREAHTLWDTWSSRRNILDLIKDAYRSAELGEKPVLRLFIPRGLLEVDAAGIGYVPSGTIEECLNYIHVQLITGQNAAFVTDDETQLSGYICYTNSTTNQIVEVSTLVGNQTMLRVSVNGQEDIWEIDMCGMYTMHAPRLLPCITKSIIQQQKAWNFTNTSMVRNVTVGGFTERIILDAQPPGNWIDDPNEPDKQIFVPIPIDVSPGNVTFVAAAEHFQDETGMKTIGHPHIYDKDPVDNGVFIDTQMAQYQNLLYDVGQGFVLTDARAATSGEARIAARDIFNRTLTNDARPLTETLEWLMTAPLHMASWLAGQPRHFEALKPAVSCHIISGLAVGTERSDNREDYRAGIISRETAMSRAGVDDTYAELLQMNTEQDQQLSPVAQQVALVQALVGAGANMQQAIDFIKSVQLDRTSIPTQAAITSED